MPGHYRAACHCGNMEATFETPHSLESLGVRACACSFCRKHQTLTATDPDGKLHIRIRHSDKFTRYRFGMKMTDFLICSECGIYVAAVFSDGRDLFGTLNLRVLEPSAPLPAAQTVDYENETQEKRRMRRKMSWTPVKEIQIGR